MNIENIGLEKLRENDWNPNRVPEKIFRALVKNIRESGFVQPLLVRPAGGAYEVLDGAHRLRALKELDAEEAECVIVDDEDQAARMRTLAMNRLRGAFDHEELARVLETTDMEDEAIREALAYSENELAEIRGLLESEPQLDFNVSEAEHYELFDFYLAPEEAEILREALGATGEKDRARAITIVAKGYLENARPGD